MAVPNHWLEKKHLIVVVIYAQMSPRLERHFQDALEFWVVESVVAVGVEFFGAAISVLLPLAVDLPFWWWRLVVELLLAQRVRIFSLWWPMPMPMPFSRGHRANSWQKREHLFAIA